MGHQQTNMVIPHRSGITAESGLRRRAAQELAKKEPAMKFLS